MALCALATEFANAARLHGRAAAADAGAGRIRDSQALAGLVAAGEPAAAGGAWLPTPEEVEFGLTSRWDGRRTAGPLVHADRQRLARIDDLPRHGRPSPAAARFIRAVREQLGRHAGQAAMPHQPG